MNNPKRVFEPIKVLYNKAIKKESYNAQIAQVTTRENEEKIAYNAGHINMVSIRDRWGMRALNWKFLVERLSRGKSYKIRPTFFGLSFNLISEIGLLNNNAHWLTRDMIHSRELDTQIRRWNQELEREGKQICVTAFTAFKAG